VKDEFDGLIKVVAHFTVIFKSILFDTRTQDLPILNKVLSIKFGHCFEAWLCGGGRGV